MTKDAVVRKCPVCGSMELRPCGQYMDQLRCTLCGTADSVNQFPVVGNLLDLVPVVPIVHYTPKLGGEEISVHDPRHPLWAGRERDPEVVSSARSVSEHHAAYNHVPPQEIQDALALIERFFASRNAKTWAFGSIQSRSETSVLENALRGNALGGEYAAPTLDREQLAIYASAFRCVLVPRAKQEDIDRLAEKLADRLGPGWAFAGSMEKAQCRDHVIELLQEIGVY